MKSRHVAIGFVIAAAGFLLGQVAAQEGGEGPPKPEWTKPTKYHAEMKESVGTWDVAAEMWMAPGAPPMKFNGTSERKMVLNGMYVQETFRCDFMGQPYEGYGFQGYDTIRKEWFHIWMGNDSPIAGIMRGKPQEGVSTMTGEAVDYMTGQPNKVRSTLESKGPDQSTFTMYETPAGGQERMSFRMVYTRKK